METKETAKTGTISKKLCIVLFQRSHSRLVTAHSSPSRHAASQKLIIKASTGDAIFQEHAYADRNYRFGQHQEVHRRFPFALSWPRLRLTGGKPNRLRPRPARPANHIDQEAG